MHNLGRAIIPVLFLFFLLLASPVSALVQHGEMMIYAVTTEGKGLSATLILDIEPGKGMVWSSVSPLVGTTTQNAEKVALEVAKKYSPEIQNYDYKFQILSDASVVEGPSAGAAMALLLVSMLGDRNVPKGVSITGTITAGGYVGPVGGVFEKAGEASRTGVKLFMIPQGEAKQTVKLDTGVQSINLAEYAMQEWGMKVVEVETIDDVLKYAFSDIETIDVNAGGSKTLADFVPKPIRYAAQLAPMKELTVRYLKECKELINEARNSLSTTLLDDAALISVLLESLSNSQETLQQAEILSDQNYLYSAANYAFLARVNAMLVRDISENPSLLSPDSTALSMRLFELKQNLDALREDLGGSVPVDCLEWHISAQQRLTYAQNNIKRLMETETIVIGASKDEEYAARLRDLQDYEFARAWYSISKDFYQICRASEKRVLPGNAFKDSMAEMIIATENSLTVIADDDGREDIERRLTASKSERDAGWYETSLSDAASAYALIVGQDAAEGKSIPQLYALLREKISGLDRNISSSPYPFVWPTLYLDHAKYYLASADFYQEQGRSMNAISALKNGIGLALLAEQLYLVSDSIYGYYSAIPPTEYLPEEGAARYPVAKTEDQTVLLAVVGALLLILAVLAIILARLMLSRHPYLSVASEIKHIKKLRRKADEAFMKGRMNEKKHTLLTEKYDSEIAGLESMCRSRSTYALELDRLRAEMVAFRYRLRDLKEHFHDGIITKQDYMRAVGEYNRHISEIQGEIAEENALLQRVEAELEKPKKTGSKSKGSGLPVSVGGEEVVAVSAQQKPRGEAVPAKPQAKAPRTKKPRKKKMF